MSKRALVLIDLQRDYFPGGLCTLHRADEAVEKAAQVLEAARAAGDYVVHVHHEFQSDDAPFFRPGSEGAFIHDRVKPLDGEDTVLKHQVNAFLETNLKELLDARGITYITFVGMMSHMCIDAATRAASDFGFSNIVIEDACATFDQEFGGRVVPAEDVHAAYMSALSFAYATVTTADSYLAS